MSRIKTRRTSPLTCIRSLDADATDARSSLGTPSGLDIESHFVTELSTATIGATGALERR